MREVRIKLVSNDPAIDYPIEKPEDAIVVMQKLIGDMANEFFAAVYLDTKNRPLDYLIAGIGGTDHTMFELGSVVKGALLQNSVKVILFHNHPSGDIYPSKSDIASTERFILAGKINGIEILDHVIIFKEKYYSFAENGMIAVNDKNYLEGLRELMEMSAEEFNKKYSFQINNNDNNIESALII